MITPAIDTGEHPARLRLCYVADIASFHALRWVKYFAGKGHSVVVLSPTMAGAITNAGEIPDGIRVYGLLRTPTLPKIIQLTNVFAVRRVLHTFRPHVLHAHYVRIYGWIAALAFFRPFVLTAWGGDILEDQGALSDFFGRKLTPFSIRRADLLTVHSGFLRDRVIALGGAPDKIQMVGCPGVDRKLFRPGLDSDSLRRELGLGDAPVVLCTRLIDKLYNTETILGAIPLVLKEIPGTRFIFSEYMGNKSHVEEIKSAARKLGLADSVLFVREIPHERMPLFLNLARAFVSIPDSDGMPQSLLEAMSCGTVPIVSPLPQYAGVVEDGVNALTVARKDERAVAEAILRVLKDDALRDTLSHACIATTTDCMDYEKEMEKMERLYYELAGSAAGEGNRV